MNEDGTLRMDGDIGCCYKPIFPLRSAGYTAQSSLLLKKVMELFNQPAGDLRGPDGRKGSGNYANNCCQVYPNGRVALLSHQDAGSGRQRWGGSFLMPGMTEADLTVKMNCNLIPEWFFEVAAELSGV